MGQQLPLFKEKKCERCEKNAATSPHSCPYQADVNEDSETLCTCCEDCEYECAMDI